MNKYVTLIILLLVCAAHAGVSVSTSDNAALTNGAALGETAWQNPASATNWLWSKTATAVTLTNYTGPNAVVIPEMLDGLPVTGFGTVFSPGALGSSITSVSGKNITTVVASAFRKCASLTSVSLPLVTSIGDVAFRQCTSLPSAFFPLASSIGASAFRECAALTSVSLPMVTSMGVSVFYDCTALASVSLPMVTSIGDYTFVNCGLLTSVFYGANAPPEGTGIYTGATAVTNYVSTSTATGWGATWNDRPVVRMSVYADDLYAGGTDVVTRISSAVANHAAAADPHGDRAYADGLVTDMPGWGVTNGLLYLDAGSVTGLVFRLGPTNIYLWQVQP